MSKLVGELADLYDYLFRILEFPELLGKLFLILFKFANLDFGQFQVMAIPTKDLFHKLSKKQEKEAVPNFV